MTFRNLNVSCCPCSSSEGRKSAWASTPFTREEAAATIGISTRLFDRIAKKKGILKPYETIYGLRYRIGDVVAYMQMRCEGAVFSTPKPFNIKSKRKMSDLDRLMSQSIRFDIDHQPLSLD